MVELAYFTFSLFIPQIWPDQNPNTVNPGKCSLEFNQVTLCYMIGLLGIMIPLRSFMQTRRSDANPQFITKLFGVLTTVHMVLSLGFLLYSLTMLSRAENDCWKPFTWLYLNYYLLILIVIGPAMTLGVILIVMLVCSPCIIHMLVKSCRDERERTRMG